MKILLARHGNTFEPGEPVVWAGATNDLKLAAKGTEQALHLADLLTRQREKLSAIYSSELSRTYDYASLVSTGIQSGLEPIKDSRLHEIDYGAWTGLTNDEVAARFGEGPLMNWDKKSEWPDVGGWGGSEAAIVSELQSFLKDLISRHRENETLLVVSSNGRLRYFLKLIEGEFEKRVSSGTFKMATGRLSRINYLDGRFTLSYWNEDPKVMGRV